MARAIILLLLFPIWVQADTFTILKESFESAPSVDTYTSDHFFDDGADYFVRTNSSHAAYQNHPSNPDGSFYIVLEDTDNTGGGPPNGVAFLTLTNVDVSAFSNLKVVVSFFTGGTDFEQSDRMIIMVVTNFGTTNNVFPLRGVNPNADYISHDADNSGAGDNVLNTETDLTDFTYTLPILGGQVTNIIVQIRTFASANNEEMGYDNIRILGDAPPVETVSGFVDFEIQFTNPLLGEFPRNE